MPMLMMDSGNNLHVHVAYSAILSAIFVNWQGKEWNKNFIRKRGFCVRICILTVCGLLYLSLWTSAIYFNANITTTYGDKVPLRMPSISFLPPVNGKTRKNISEIYIDITNFVAGKTYGRK
jgi:hypothetical protein